MVTNNTTNNSPDMEVDTSMDTDTPRDVRLLHLLLASQAIHQYEDRVPLQLMDFAYRYTKGVLKDAMIYSEYKENNLVEDTTSSSNTSSANNNTSNDTTTVTVDGTTHNITNNGTTTTDNAATGVPATTTSTTTATTTTTTNSTSASAPGQLTVEDIRLAIASRTQYQFKPTAPKELLLKLASERNKKSLPQVMGSWGVRLPPEKYCITAKEFPINPPINKS